MIGVRWLAIGVLAALLVGAAPAKAADAQPRLVSYGHSWPSGLGVQLPYPDRVADRRDLSLSNRAQPGDLSADTLSRVRLRPPRRIDIVTVQTGVNDANLYGLAGLASYQRNLRAILRETQRAALVVLVLDQHAWQPSDIPPYDHGTPAVIHAYRLVAREVAEAAGAIVVAPVLGVVTEWQADGMHPSGAGHRVIAAAIAAAIKRNGG